MEIDADLTEPPLISTAPSPCTPSMPCWGGGGDGCGYSAEVIPWLMWHVCLRPWRLLTARIIIVIMWQLKRERSIRTGGGGLWSERWMCTDYKAVGNALRWQSILTPPLSSSKAAGYYRPSSLISIPNQYSSAAVKTGVNQRAAGERSDTQEEKSKGGS